MRPLISFLTTLILFISAAPGARAYFKEGLPRGQSLNSMMRDLSIRPAVNLGDWPDWIGVPAWVSVVDKSADSQVHFGSSLRQAIPTGAIYDAAWQGTGWPDWIGAPGWMNPENNR